MNRNKQHNRIGNLNRNQYSSFVVDLRAAALKSEKEEASKNNKKFSWAEFLSPLKNIMAPRLEARVSRNKFHLSLHLPEKKNKNKFWNKTLVFWRKKSAWRRAVRWQQRVLSSRFHPAMKRKLAKAEREAAWYRSLLTFSLILLFLVIPLKLLSQLDILDISSLEEKVMAQSKAALGQMMTAVDSAAALDFQEASQAFSEASSGFLSAKDDLGSIGDSLLFLASLSNDPKLKLAAESKKFLAAGALSASLGRNLVLATDSLFNHTKDESFVAALESFSIYGEAAVADAKELEKIINSINPNNLPTEYRAQFVAMSGQAASVSSSLDSFVSSAKKAKDLLGKSRDKRYLLVFQNNAELRASGGFLGSYALLDVSKGKIKNLEVPAGGSYDTEGGMTVNVKAPEPLWLVNPLWHFWDANWWPDWPKTAKNLMWFYDKSGGPTVDGVISLTPTVVESLLEITGPIDMTAEYGVVIDSNNFWETTQKIVERKNLEQTHPETVVNFKESLGAIEATIPLEQDLLNNPDNKPKKIIGDLMARILEILPEKLDKTNLIKIVSLFENNLAEKQILFYFTDPVLQAEASKRNWAGEVKPVENDYLLVVNTNIAGQKSDRKMEEKIEHVSTVSPDGRIINTVKIYRGHTGIKNEALTGVRNVNWLRVYVPAGSRLISASGFSRPDAEYFEEPDPSWLDSQFLAEEKLALTDPLSGAKIYTEHDKTVFAGWVMTDPGQTAEITFVYELPFNFFRSLARDGFLDKLNSLLNPESKTLYPYSLLVQKQPGAKPSLFSSVLKAPAGLEVRWQHPKSLAWQNGWSYTGEIGADKYISVLLGK